MNGRPLLPLVSLALATSIVVVTLLAGGASAETLAVTRTDDPIPDGCAPTDCSLREAIMAANEAPGADTIDLPAGTYVMTLENPMNRVSGGGLSDNPTSGDLEITDDLSIVGDGASSTIIDGGSIDRVFEVRPAVAIAVIMEGITISNGLPDPGFGAQGGGIDASGPQGTTLELRNVTISDNSATYGAGLSIRGTISATVMNSLITMNRAGENKQGWGAGVNVEEEATVVIDRTTVSDNHGEEGGGVVNINNDAQVTIMDSTISGNESTTYGGGVFGGGSELNRTTIVNSTIVNNSAGDGGGGIYQAGGALIIDNSTISGNFAGNASDQGGGGLMQDSDGPITVTNSTIANNESDANGDGVYLQDEGPVTFRNTIIANNGSKNCESFPGTGVVISEGHNLVNDQDCNFHSMGDRVGNPNLGPLADNGGPTQTHALMDGSDAIDEGDSKNCPETDQRGYLRPAGVSCDVGAFEAGATEPTPTPSPTPAGTLRTFGDVTCNGSADSVDALAIQRDQANLPVNQTQPCPGIGDVVDIQDASEHPWGDADCDDDVDTVDSLKILRFVAGLAVQQEPDCPALGSSVITIKTEGAP